MWLRASAGFLLRSSRTRRTARLARAIVALGLAAGCARAEKGSPPIPPTPTPRRAVRVLAVHPHDPAAFTQGLLFHAGKLYESTGLEGASRLREVEIASGRVVREVRLPGREFGEGLALAGDRLVQLTWRDGVARSWRLADFAPLAIFTIPGEGWGLTFDGRRFVQSDGSDRLTFRDAESFAPTGTLAVRRDGAAVAYLNELEWARDRIFANVWMSDEIVAIDPGTGAVVATWDATGLLTPEEAGRADVFNGIAHDPTRDVFYVTGKLWPRLFEVALD